MSRNFLALEVLLETRRQLDFIPDKISIVETAFIGILIGESEFRVLV